MLASREAIWLAVADGMAWSVRPAPLDAVEEVPGDVELGGAAERLHAVSAGREAARIKESHSLTISSR